MYSRWIRMFCCAYMIATLMLTAIYLQMHADTVSRHRALTTTSSLRAMIIRVKDRLSFKPATISDLQLSQQDNRGPGVVCSHTTRKVTGSSPDWY